MRRDGVIAVYIMANRRNGTIYTGATSDLSRRAYEHREGALEGFTKKYSCTRLVWFEPYELIARASDQELASALEDRSDRGIEPDLARSV